MSLWDRLLFGGVRDDRQTVIAHVLDANTGYSRRSWTLGEETSEENVSAWGDNGSIFVVVSYEDGERHAAVCNRTVWNRAKRRFAAANRGVRGFRS